MQGISIANVSMLCELVGLIVLIFFLHACLKNKHVDLQVNTFKKRKPALTVANLHI